MLFLGTLSDYTYYAFGTSKKRFFCLLVFCRLDFSVRCSGGWHLAPQDKSGSLRIIVCIMLSKFLCSFMEAVALLRVLLWVELGPPKTSKNPPKILPKFFPNKCKNHQTCSKKYIPPKKTSKYSSKYPRTLLCVSSISNPQNSPPTTNTLSEAEPGCLPNLSQLALRSWTCGRASVCSGADFEMCGPWAGTMAPTTWRRRSGPRGFRDPLVTLVVFLGPKTVQKLNQSESHKSQIRDCYQQKTLLNLIRALTRF